MADRKTLVEFTAFLNKQSVYLVMFGHVEAVRQNLPSVSVEAAVCQFIDKYGLNLNERSLMTIYFRMQKEFIALSRSESFLRKGVTNVV